MGVVLSYPHLQKLFSLPRTNLAEIWYVVKFGVLLLGMGVLGDKKSHSMFLEETAKICGNLSKIVHNM